MMVKTREDSTTSMNHGMERPHRRTRSRYRAYLVNFVLVGFVFRFSVLDR